MKAHHHRVVRTKHTDYSTSLKRESETGAWKDRREKRPYLSPPSSKGQPRIVDFSFEKQQNTLLRIRFSTCKKRFYKVIKTLSSIPKRRKPIDRVTATMPAPSVRKVTAELNRQTRQGMGFVFLINAAHHVHKPSCVTATGLSVHTNK